MAGERRDGEGRVPNPWDRDFVVNARTRRRSTDDDSAAHPGPTRQPATAGRAAPHRRGADPHPAFALAPWAAIVGLACSLFAAGAWLFGDRSDLSTAILVSAIVGLTLGAYAVAGAVAGRGRSDIAVGALVLASIALLVWVWMGRPTPVVRPT